MSDNCIAIINRIIEHRRRCGMTQTELAKAAGLTQSVIARMESKKSIPQLDTLLRITTALNCNVEIVAK